MAELPEPYITKQDGDLIEAGDWNEIQARARAEVERHTHTNRPVTDTDGIERFDGAQIPTDGLADGAVTAAKLDPGTRARLDGALQRSGGALSGPLTVDGNVGIGTANPQFGLQIGTVDTANNGLRITNVGIVTSKSV